MTTRAPEVGGANKNWTHFFLSSKKGVDLDRAVTTTATSQYSGMEPIGFFKDNRTGFKCKMISEREIHCDLTVM